MGNNSLIPVDTLIRLPEAAKRVGVSPKVLRARVRRGELRAVKLNSHDWRIPGWALAAFSRGEKCA